MACGRGQAHAKRLAAAGCKLFAATNVPYGQVSCGASACRGVTRPGKQAASAVGPGQAIVARRSRGDEMAPKSHPRTSLIMTLAPCPRCLVVWRPQNLAASFGSTAPQCRSAVDLWYSQSKNYAFTRAPFTDNVVAGKQVNSFTQVCAVEFCSHLVRPSLAKQVCHVKSCTRGGTRRRWSGATASCWGAAARPTPPRGVGCCSCVAVAVGGASGTRHLALR